MNRKVSINIAPNEIQLKCVRKIIKMFSNICINGQPASEQSTPTHTHIEENKETCKLENATTHTTTLYTRAQSQSGGVWLLHSAVVDAILCASQAVAFCHKWDLRVATLASTYLLTLRMSASSGFLALDSLKVQIFEEKSYRVCMYIHMYVWMCCTQQSAYKPQILVNTVPNHW